MSITKCYIYVYFYFYNLRMLCQAVNSAGVSPYSNVSWSQSPMSSPGAISSVRATSTPRSIHLYWKEPVCNGSRILSYNIDLGDQRPMFSVDADVLDCNIMDLMPETAYKLVTRSVTILLITRFCIVPNVWIFWHTRQCNLLLLPMLIVFVELMRVDNDSLFRIPVRHILYRL